MTFTNVIELIPGLATHCLWSHGMLLAEDIGGMPWQRLAGSISGRMRVVQNRACACTVEVEQESLFCNCCTRVVTPSC